MISNKGAVFVTTMDTDRVQRCPKRWHMENVAKAQSFVAKTDNDGAAPKTRNGNVVGEQHITTRGWFIVNACSTVRRHV